MALFTLLRPKLKGKIALLGIGNIMRGDDGVGSVLASWLKTKVNFLVYDCSESPENYLGKVIKDAPEVIILVDAVDFGAKPGELKILQKENLQTANLFFTHNVSLGIVVEYLKRHLASDIIILMVQPKTIALGDNLSPEVEKVVKKLEKFFLSLK